MFTGKGKLATVEEGFRVVMVAGDIHGDFQAFKKIEKIFHETQDGVLIFLGDYADRGDQGLEVIQGVSAMMERCPDRVIPLKGNHEDYREGKPCFSPWTLGEEVEAKTGKPWEDFFPEMERFIQKLFLGAVIPGVALFLHGGISSRLKDLRDLENPDPALEEDILWSDPMDENGECPNPRGAGVLFGPDVGRSVLGKVGVKLLIRSHQPQKAAEGPFLEHGRRVLTISSTSIYGGRPFLLTIQTGAHLKRSEMGCIYL